MTNDCTPSSPSPDGRRRHLLETYRAEDHVRATLRHAELVPTEGAQVLLLFFVTLPTDPAAATYALTVRALELPYN